jgi:glutathione synthase/RimK-type ligase-like ATP-grasp enzyme
MILLWGLLEDDTMRSVHDSLLKRGAVPVFVNHAEIDKTHIGFTTHGAPAFMLDSDGRRINLGEVNAAYLRPYDFRDYEQYSGAGGQPLEADLVHHLMNNWAEHTTAFVISRPSAEATNHSKLFQARRIRSSGFLVPDSLITNDAGAIEEFRVKHPELIYKSMSSVRSIVKELTPEEPDAGGKKIGPVFFQQRIRGKNIRVHVVGSRVFPALIESEEIDYRYAPASIRPVGLPALIADRCIRLSHDLGLPLSGIDLITTDEGQWYCLEVNPNPAFSCYERTDDLEIADAVAGLLINPAAC